MKRNLPIVKYILIPLLLTFLFTSCGEKSAGKHTGVQKKVDTARIHVENVKKDIEENLISIIGVGDIMMGSNYPSDYSLPPNDGKNLFDSVSLLLKSADITFGNLEGTFLNSGGKPKECLTPDNCHSFRMPEHYSGYLLEAGFDVVSLANNHSNDMGQQGKEATVSALDEVNIHHAGYTDFPSVTFETKGKKIGFAAFAPNAGTVSINDIPKAVKIVTDLKKICNIVIVSFHGGAEGFGATRVGNKREFYLGEDRGSVVQFSHAVIDAGADVVFGHGPHVPRAIELYNDKIIAYSLGNFCTYGKFGLGGAQGFAPVLEVWVDDLGNFNKGKIHSFKQVNRGVPVPDDQLQAAALIGKLSQLDFPSDDITINSAGEIIKTNNKVTSENTEKNEDSN